MSIKLGPKRPVEMALVEITIDEVMTGVPLPGSDYTTLVIRNLYGSIERGAQALVDDVMALKQAGFNLGEAKMKLVSVLAREPFCGNCGKTAQECMCALIREVQESPEGWNKFLAELESRGAVVKSVKMPGTPVTTLTVSDGSDEESPPQECPKCGYAGDDWRYHDCGVMDGCGA